MAGPYSLFGTDKNLESGDGVSLDYPGFSITIRRAGGSNVDFSRVLSEKLRPYRKKLDKGTMDDKVSEKILLETYAETVVINWKNVKDRKGHDMPCTAHNCVKLFTDLPDLFRDVQDQANDYKLFLEDQEELEEKNL